MSSGVPSNPPRRTVTYAAAELDTVNGVKVSFPTVAAPVELGAADYDGGGVASAGTLWAKLPRAVTISRSSAAASYTTDPILLAGRRGGVLITEELVPANGNGGDILRGVTIWDRPPTIAFPAQVDGAGAFQIGVGDIGTNHPSDTFVGVTVRDAAGGQLNVQYGEGNGAPVDSFAVPGWGHERIAPTRIRTSAALAVPTTVAITVELP